MPGQGIQFLPLSRIPKEWDPVWFAKFCREVLALADTRNAIEGSGITITGQPGEVATVSASDDLQNLLLQSYVLASPSGFLGFERVLTEGDAISIVDGGANSTITVGVDDNSVSLGKLLPLSGAGVLGNPVDDVGTIQNITPEVALSVVHWDGTNVLFDLIDSTYVSDFAEAAQDAVGGIFTDSASINFTYDDGAGTITAAVIESWAPTWSARHTFTNSAGTQILTGTTTVNANPVAGEVSHLLDFVNPDGTYQMMRLSSYGTGGFQNNWHWMRARGTVASPTAIMSGDFFMSMGLRGHDGTAVSQSAGAFQGLTTENWSNTAHGCEYRFETTPNGSTTRRSALTIGQGVLTSHLEHTFSGRITSGAVIGSGSGNAFESIDGGAGSLRALLFQSGGLSRWAAIADNVAESGSNSGSPLSFWRYTDAGGFLGVALTMDRATGDATFERQVAAAASTTAAASFRAPHGAAPSSPVNGDIWTTTAGLFVRINGATIGPLT